MTRRTLHIGAILSLAWLAALALLWALSYAHTGVGSFKTGDSTCCFLSSHRGRVTVGVQSITPGTWADPSYRAEVGRYGEMRVTHDGNTATAMSFDPHWIQKGFLGFGKSRWRGITTVGGTTHSEEANIYAAPWWAVAVVGGIPAAVPLLRLRRVHLRRRRGCCVRCGYDLRGGGERCPECGADVAGWAATIRRVVRTLARLKPRARLAPAP